MDATSTVVSDDASIRVKDLVLNLPDGQPLLAASSVAFKPGENVLLTGASGSGKSTVFRALAGIWPFGRGIVSRPRAAEILFLPQKPYLNIGPLRDQLCYPAASGTFTDGEIRGALVDCMLGHLMDRLDEVQHWAQLLSGGEQQRVAFARALLHKPAWLFMDEATSALDEQTEATLYGLLAQRLPGTTIVSIGHRETLRQFHQRRLKISRHDHSAAVLLPAA